MHEQYLPTGNEWVSLPTLQARTGALESFSFLHMGYKGLIEQRGAASLPLMAPFFELDGEKIPLQSLTWARKSDWIPTFHGIAGPLEVEGMLLAPVGERGFLYQLTVRSTLDRPLSGTFGLEGCWASAWHCVNEDKEIDGVRRCYTSLWNDSLIFDMRCGLPLFAFAPMMDQPCSSTFRETDAGIAYRLAHDCTLEPGQAAAVTFYWGVGFEEVAAATSAKEMLRQGWQHELEMTVDWLEARRWPIPDAQLERLYNTNLFFCLFYSAGLTLDTEELVLVTSRSPRYYVSAAYWDRDSLLWSFPIPIILSLCINQVRFKKYKRVVQTVLYAPHFISIMVVSGMIRIFLSPSGGLINLILGTSIDFLTESSAFRTIYIASGIWQDAGWGCIIYLATLSNVDTTLYEAAKVDGASVFQRILHIDVPALMPMVILNLIMSAGNLMNIGFEKVWLLQTDLNKATSDVIAVYVYQQGIENANYSYSTAVGLFNTAINLILLIIVNRIASKASDVEFV